MFSALFYAIMVCALFAGAYGVAQAVLGLRAKAAARRVLAHARVSNGQLQELAERLNAGNLANTDVDEAVRTIRESLTGKLSAGAFRRIGQGLSQPGRVAERRFIEDLLSTS